MLFRDWVETNKDREIAVIVLGAERFIAGIDWILENLTTPRSKILAVKIQARRFMRLACLDDNIDVVEEDVFWKLNWRISGGIPSFIWDALLRASPDKISNIAVLLYSEIMSKERFNRLGRWT